MRFSQCRRTKSGVLGVAIALKPFALRRMVSERRVGPLVEMRGRENNRNIEFVLKTLRPG
jgi:hypothetical protein